MKSSTSSKLFTLYLSVGPGWRMDARAQEAQKDEAGRWPELQPQPEAIDAPKGRSRANYTAMNFKAIQLSSQCQAK